MVRRLVRVALYPSLLAGALAATFVGMRAGFDPGLLAGAVVILVPLPLLVAQRFVPAVPEWRGQPKDFSIDLLHLFSTWGAAEASRALTVAVVTTAAVWLREWFGAHLWPVAAPILLQLALAMLMGDFLAYWLHRACHTFPLLWRIHAMHHSSERLYVFAAARNHPLNAFLMHLLHLLPVTLLGAPTEVIALASVFTGVHGLLQHANVDLRHGWLNRVFATAELHRWHHSAVPEESRSNYGNNLIIWDTLFGTRHLPDGPPVRVGLGAERMRDNFLVHLASPFVLYRVLTGTPAPVRESAPR